MKTIKTLAILFLAIVAMSSCTKDDNPAVAKPASQAQIEALAGHWYADLPISGETMDLRTMDDPNDKTAYNHIGAIIYFNSKYTNWSYWGYFYMNDDEFVNVEGLNRLTEDAGFDFTMDSEGHITPTAHLPNAPQVSNMRFEGDKITATVTYMGHSLDITFRQPDEEQNTMLEGIWEFLLDNGMVIGGNDEKVETGISDKQADEPARARWR